MLKPHGQRIRPEYAAPDGEVGWAGTSTNETRPGGETSGIVTRYKKNTSTYKKPQAFGWIKEVYPEAIEFIGMTKEMRGYSFTMGNIFGLMFISTSFLTGKLTIWAEGSKNSTDPFLISVIIFQILVGIFFFVYFLRFDLFRPTDLPIIFDRKNRKIFRILREEQPGPLGAFKPWPIHVCEYDWNLVDAEHQSTVFTTGGTMRRDHYLMFIVRKSEDDPTIIDSFQIGSSMDLDAERVDAMWEHIRRFMEERGSHLPNGDERLADLRQPESWWQSMGAVGLLGPNYFQHWRELPVVTLALHLTFPATIPFLLLWGTGNWLSYKTAIPVQWPEEVVRAVQG